MVVSFPTYMVFIGMGTRPQLTKLRSCPDQKFTCSARARRRRDYVWRNVTCKTLNVNRTQFLCHVLDMREEKLFWLQFSCLP